MLEYLLIDLPSDVDSNEKLQAFINDIALEGWKLNEISDKSICFERQLRGQSSYLEKIRKRASIVIK